MPDWIKENSKVCYFNVERTARAIQSIHLNNLYIKAIIVQQSLIFAIMQNEDSVNTDFMWWLWL